MIWSDVIPQEAKDLGTMTAQGILALGVVTFAVALVWMFKTWRSDVKELNEKHEKRLDDSQEKHETAIKEQRTEHTQAMNKVVDAIKAVADESRAHADECRANFVALNVKVDQLKK